MELTMRILPDGFFYFFWESEVGQRRRRVGQPWGRLDGGMQSDVMVFWPYLSGGGLSILCLCFACRVGLSPSCLPAFLSAGPLPVWTAEWWTQDDRTIAKHISEPKSDHMLQHASEHMPDWMRGHMSECMSEGYARTLVRLDHFRTQARMDPEHTSHGVSERVSQSGHPAFFQFAPCGSLEVSHVHFHLQVKVL